MSTQVSVRLEEHIQKRLGDVAALSGKSVAHIIRQCIEDHLDDLEDLYVSLRRLESGEPMVSLEEVMTELDIHDDDLAS